MGKQVLLIEVSDALSGQIPCHLGKYEMAAVGAPRVVFTPPQSYLSDRLKTIEDDYKGLRLSANAMNTEPWVTAEQVAQHLGVVKDTV